MKAWAPLWGGLFRDVWLSIGAFLLVLVALLVLPWLPAPLTYFWPLTPVLLLIATVYESSARFGVPVSQRLRLIVALWSGLWMGLAGLSLMLGLLARWSAALLVAAVATGFVLGMAGLLTMAIFIGRRARRERVSQHSGFSN
jgi:hypothetical protein